METTRINLNEEPKGKKETERLNVNTEAECYTEPVVDNTDQAEETDPNASKKKILGDAAKMAAAGAIGGIVGGGTAMAAGLSHDGENVPEEEPVAEPTPAPAPKPNPKPDTASTTETEPETEQVLEEVVEEVQEPAAEVTSGPAPVDSPHIEEILVDTEDIDGEKIMNIEGTGTVEIEGVEFNTAVVTDEAGNTYFMVDVDGEVNDPNATYDIIVDAETGEGSLLPTSLSVSDAQLMADNGIAYTNPNPDDSNNVAHDEMVADIYDPSQPTQEEYIPEEQYDPLADNSLDAGADLLDSLS